MLSSAATMERDATASNGCSSSGAPSGHVIRPTAARIARSRSAAMRPARAALAANVRLRRLAACSPNAASNRATSICGAGTDGRTAARGTICRSAFCCIGMCSRPRGTVHSAAGLNDGTERVRARAGVEIVTVLDTGCCGLTAGTGSCTDTPRPICRSITATAPSCTGTGAGLGRDPVMGTVITRSCPTCGRSAAVTAPWMPDVRTALGRSAVGGAFVGKVVTSKTGAWTDLTDAI